MGTTPFSCPEDLQQQDMEGKPRRRVLSLGYERKSEAEGEDSSRDPNSERIEKPDEGKPQPAPNGPVQEHELAEGPKLSGPHLAVGVSGDG